MAIEVSAVERMRGSLAALAARSVIAVVRSDRFTPIRGHGWQRTAEMYVAGGETE
jgi:hypothetical protein